MMRPSVLALTAATALSLTACGTGAKSSSSASAPELVPAGGAVQPAAAGFGTAPQAAAPAADVGIDIGAPNGDVERSVTAAYTVPQGSFLSAFDLLTARGVQLGGYILSSQTSANASGRIVGGSLTMKIPATQLATFLNSMPADFSASSINFGSIDHTADVIDVNARLASATAHLTALQHLLAAATSLDDITNLEQQIEGVQQAVDTDEGQLNLLSNKVTYATTTIELSERGALIAAQPPVSNGLSRGWNNALALSGALLEGLITALPLLLLAAVSAAVWRWLVRRPSRQRSLS